MSTKEEILAINEDDEERGSNLYEVEITIPVTIRVYAEAVDEAVYLAEEWLDNNSPDLPMLSDMVVNELF